MLPFCFINLAIFFLDLLLWRCVYVFLFQARGQLDTHTHRMFVLFCVKLIDLRFQFSLRWGPKSVLFLLHVRRSYIVCFCCYFFSMFLFCFALNVCDGSVFFLLLIFLYFNLSVCRCFLCFFLSYVECEWNGFVIVFPVYLFVWVWVSEAYLFLKNIISLFFMVTLNGFNVVCRRFFFFFLCELWAFHLPKYVCFQWFLSVCDVFGDEFLTKWRLCFGAWL